MDNIITLRLISPMIGTPGDPHDGPRPLLVDLYPGMMNHIEVEGETATLLFDCTVAVANLIRGDERFTIVPAEVPVSRAPRSIEPISEHAQRRVDALKAENATLYATLTGNARRLREAREQSTTTPEGE